MTYNLGMKCEIFISGAHPDLAEHQEIAAELSAYLKKLMNW